MSITFAAIDLNCESADHSFFPPSIRLQPKSTTTIATIYGYGEFIPSNPPKRYHTITIEGLSQRIGFTGEDTPRQCAGGKYIYGGSGTIDVHGVQTENYTKKFFTECTKQFWPIEPLQANPNSIQTGGINPRFVGFCWPDVPQSCSVCEPNDADWPFIGNVATNNPLTDLVAFIYSGQPTQTPTTWSINNVLNAQTEIDPKLNFPHTVRPSGFPPPDDLIVAAYILWQDINNYTATLSHESTDQEAIENAKVIQGTSATTQNSVQTTGLPALVGKVTTTTTVIFTLVLTNLIIDQSYIVTVDFWEQDPSSDFSQHTTRTYSVFADSTSQTITDIVPDPDLGHTITVRNPKIVFNS